MTAALDILPDTRASRSRRSIIQGGVEWVPLWCFNCRAGGGWVTKDELGADFAFYSCDACLAKFGEPIGLAKLPMQAFWEKVAEAQIEKYGRVLKPLEQAVELERRPRGVLALLVREFNKLIRWRRS